MMPFKLLITLGLAVLLYGCGVGDLDLELESNRELASDEVEAGVVKVDNIVIQCVMRKPRVLFVLPTSTLPVPDLPTEELSAFRLTKQITAVARANREALTRLDKQLTVLRSAGTLSRLLTPRRAALRRQRVELIKQATSRMEALTRVEERAYRALERRLRAGLAGQQDPARRASALFALARASQTLEAMAYMRALERYEHQLENDDQAQLPDEPEAPQREVAPTLQALNALIQEFPRYRHLDAALYLRGLVLLEADKSRDGARALLALVCPTLSLAPGAPLTGASYAGCAPLRPNSRFNAEAWLRVGEHHFDLNQLDQAAAAYTQSMGRGPRDNPSYDQALFKLAWSRYRNHRYAEAAASFDALLQVTPSSELRVEATQYLAISLAEPDWDRDGRPDVESPLQRVERLFGGRWHERDVPQVYRGLGDVLFDSARQQQAAEVYHVMVGRWPRSTLAGAARQRLLQIQRR